MSGNNRVWPGPGPDFGLGLIAVFSFCLTACQSQPVQPWEKEILAQPAMQFDTSDLDLLMEDHFYFSKEGSSGGRGISAGGCGCN